jgi:hypothetical protein
MKSLPAPPSTHSALIRLAVHDLEKVERDKRYEIDMRAWHAPGTPDNNVCYVCFAGSVMANSLNAPLNEYRSPNQFSDKWYRAFIFLNNIRMGKGTRNPETGNHFRWEVPTYGSNPTAFKLAMLGIAAWYETQGD